MPFSPSPQLGIWGVSGVDGQRSGKLDKRGKSVNVSLNFGATSCVCACVCSCVGGSAHGSGCMVDGRNATAAI